MEEKDVFINRKEIEELQLIYDELPNLLHKILMIRTIPEMQSKEILENNIEEIKKITNTECESVLSYFNKLINS